ncbi:MAG: heme exporter protein CcmD [Bosea sp. (in: a-proteobacteria)]
MITSLGPHAGFIIASYAAAILLIGGLTLAIIADHRRQTRLLNARDPRQKADPELGQ